MNVGDIVMWRDPEFGHNRFWEIRAVCLGAEGQESLVRLVSMTEKPGKDEYGAQHASTVVPEPLLRSMTIYTPQIKRAA